MSGIERDRIERVARIYSSSEGASKALGITPRSFNRLCQQYQVETPQARRRRRQTGANQPKPRDGQS